MSLKDLNQQNKKIGPYARVKSLLVLKGIRNDDLVKALNVSPALISMVLSGKGESRRVKEAIAEVLDVPFDDLWKKAA